MEEDIDVDSLTNLQKRAYRELSRYRRLIAECEDRAKTCEEVMKQNDADLEEYRRQVFVYERGFARLVGLEKELDELK